MMKYGAMNFPIKPVEDEIKQIAKMGFDYIELTMDPPEANPEKLIKKRKEILELLSSYKLGIIGHLPCFIRTADLYQSIRQASRTELLNALEVAPEFSIKKLVLHPSYISGLGWELKNKVKKLGIEFLNIVYERAQELKITLCLENMLPETGWLVEPEEFKEIFKRYKNMKFMLDFGHANIKTKENRIAKFIKLYGKRIAHLHVHDNSGKEDEHLPPGCAKIKFSELFHIIKKTGYNDTMTLEVFCPDRDYLKFSLQKVKQLWKSA